MLDYKVIYSVRRTVTLTFDKDGALLLRAPIGTSKKRLDTIVREHASWIEKHKIRAEKRKQADEVLTEERIAALKKQAKETLIPLTAHYAALLGVSDKEIVSVKIETNGRTTIFCDTVVRVSDSFALAMHIDTDEANAAAATCGCTGYIVK